MVHLFTRLVTVLCAFVVAGAALAQSEYRLRPGDTLAIEVLEDASLNRSVVVLPDGRFNFPFAGSLQAQGLTVTQIQGSIAAGIASNYASPPTVFVSARPLERAPTPKGTGTVTTTIDIYFIGEIGSPGLRPVAPGTTFLQAISQSGGFTPFAATKRIQLRRMNPSTGEQQVYTFNYKALANGSVEGSDAVLRDGDVILVPERRLFE